MSCAACGAPEAPGKVSLTPNVHEAICIDCCDAWVAHANATRVTQNTNGAIITAFRRWCEARKKVAA